MPNSTALALAKVMAHCGDHPEAALKFLAGAIAAAPQDPAAYATLLDLRREMPAIARLAAEPSTLAAVLADSYLSFHDGDMDRAATALGVVTGIRPDVAWAEAPWFTDERFLGGVSASGLADATTCIQDRGAQLDTEEMRDRLHPWFAAIDAVVARRPEPVQMARLAMLLRDCGRTEAAFELCDRADAIDHVMLTEVVRSGIWRHLGDRAQREAALRRALALDPESWSLLLDLADLVAENGDYAQAAELAGQAHRHEPSEITVQAAAAAYRTRSTGSVTDFDTLLSLVPEVPNPAYRNQLLDLACAASGLPADRVAAGRRAQ